MNSGYPWDSHITTQEQRDIAKLEEQLEKLKRHDRVTLIVAVAGLIVAIVAILITEL